MNIHEYQAKQLFADAGVAVPNGTVAQSADNFDHALSSLPDGKAVVVKAQIHAGGCAKNRVVVAPRRTQKRARI